MNIKEAKEQIQIAMKGYFKKDSFGNYRIPIEKQRPIFLIGPPGIGKTAIMEQIAQELGVGLVSYSMTHHTRQSALGLPFIEHKLYDGKEYAVSEYTMSEIIASVYEMMETTGLKEGILFLDEVNCVSETLAPSMLQFLQYKVFGRHRVPDGWIVVTAGNPAEYNSSVREFDIVTWDRLKRIDVEPDYDVWKEYAYRKAVHPAILTYLDIKKSDFYRIESTVDGKSFVTARGWSDLSDMIRLCEENGDRVNENLIRQYLQNRRIAKDFAVYYDLFNKYRSDYQVDSILAGKADAFMELYGVLRKISTELNSSGITAEAFLQKHIEAKQNEVANGRRASTLSSDRQYALQRCAAMLEEQRTMLLKESAADSKALLKLIKSDFDKRKKDLKKRTDATGKMLSNLFGFCEEVFADGQELLILVTELTINTYSAGFISRYGCEEYFRHNKELLFYERQKDIIDSLENLDL